MNFKSRLLAALAAVAVLGYASIASAAVQYTTSGAPPSFLTLEIWLGPPEGEVDDEPSVLLSTIGPLGINGTSNIVLSLDGFGDGTLEFLNSNLILDDAVGILLDLDVLGTIMADFVGVGLGINSTAIPVVGNIWNLDGIGAPTSLVIALDQGNLNLYDGTGFLDGVNEAIDLNEEPVAVADDDLLGFGIGGDAEENFISVIIPAIDIDLGDPLLGFPGLLYVRLLGQVNLVPVPEPGSMAMLGVGLIGLVAMGRRRFRKA